MKSIIKNLILKIIIKLKKRKIKLGILTRINVSLNNFEDSEDFIRVDRGVLTGDIKLKSGVKIFKEVSLEGNIEIGKYSSISGSGTILSSSKNKIKIGNFCSIAPNVLILGDYHNFYKITSYFIFGNLFNEKIKNEKISKGDIIIEDDVWIGGNSVILSGIKIGRGSVIGAGSVVTKNVPKYSIVVGNPGKVIKKRFSEKEIEKLEKIQWWNWSKEEILKNKKIFEKELKKVIEDV
ncbi:MAG: CatB-related O-acetyltransferase [Fusobacterium ulcerans]|uniref:CatB-related O-acetyltransferase n=1 Tax=Fusobacterium ulcerans TaxID=861 RepID=UPI003A876E49